jgi:hypothetical protein
MGVGGGAGGGVEWRGTAPARCVSEVDRDRGSGERWRGQDEPRRMQKKGRSELGLNPRCLHLIPPWTLAGPAGRAGPLQHGPATKASWAIEPIGELPSQAIKVVDRSKLGRHQEGLGHFYFSYF